MSFEQPDPRRDEDEAVPCLPGGTSSDASTAAREWKPGDPLPLPPIDELGTQQPEESERTELPAAITCEFGCGSNSEEYATPGASIVPACPVHGWVCALLESREEAIRQLRDAWNAHMATCPQHAALPVLPAPTEDELRAWRDAPSGTASA